MDIGDKTASAGVPLSTVLAPTRAGSAELAHPAAGLSLSQRKLLSRIDGQRSLANLVGTETGLTGSRVSRDGLRLLALGLAHTDELRVTQIAPTTMSRPARSTETLPQFNAEPWPSATSKRQAAQKATEVDGGRGRSMWLWAGGAAALAALAVGLLALRAQSPAVNGGAQVANVATKPAPSAALQPSPAQTTGGAAQAAASPVNTVGASAPRPAAEDAPVLPAMEQRVAAAPQASNAQAEKAQEKASAQFARGTSATAREEPKPASVAFASPAPTKAAPERQPASEATPERVTQPERSPAAPAKSEAEAQDPSLQSAPVRTAPALRAAPALAAAPASTSPAGARALLPQEREFGAVVDAEQLARQAAGVAPLQRTPPIFPRAAIREGVTEGAVRVRLTIGSDGGVERADTSVADARYRVFESAARAAAMTWTFVPGPAGRTHETVVQFRAP